MIRTHSTGRDIAMLLGGFGAGFLGSRLLPPLVAAAFGSGRVRAGGDPFELLIEDHRQILSLLDQMVDEPSGSTMRRTRLFLMFKRKLAKHALAEEDVVYPIVQNHSNGDRRKRLYGEHADMKILLHEIEGKLMRREDWSGAVRTIRELIRHHADEEENIVFPQLRQQLAERGLPKVSGQISREEALIL